MIQIVCCAALILSLVLLSAPARGDGWACDPDTVYKGTGTVVQTITYRSFRVMRRAGGDDRDFLPGGPEPL
jgi:hypothetical protein